MFYIFCFLFSIGINSQVKNNLINTFLKKSISIISKDSLYKAKLCENDFLLISLSNFKNLVKKKDIDEKDNLILIDFLTVKEASRIFKDSKNNVLRLSNFELNEDLIVVSYFLENRKIINKKKNNLVLLYETTVSGVLDVIFKYNCDLKKWEFLKLQEQLNH
ncbi:hypothetical protein TPENAI_60320 [Tenacibaculum litopenaei]